MKRLLPRSLTGRLLLYLIAGQTAFIVIAMAAFPLLAPYTSYANIADVTARRLLEASLHHGPDGALELQPSAALRRYLARRPSLAYAVVDPATGRAAPTSAPDLADMVRRLGPLLPRGYGNLETDRPAVPGDVVFITMQPTRFGPLAFVTAGNVFLWEDIPSFVDEFLPAIVPMFAPVLFGALVMVPLVVRRILRPLRSAAAAAAAIDMNTLDRRLPTPGLPSELRPLVVAINAALDRLDAGVARQRLFTANAAHELRTPVAIIQARVDALDPREPDRPYLQRDIRRLTLLLDQLLAVARIGHQEAVMDEAVDIVACVRDTVADAAPLAIRAGRRIQFEGAEGAIVVRGNARALSGAVANLIDNAIRAEPAGGIVRVAVRRGASIEVADHGPGVAAEDRDFVFEPFWRKDERTPGTGLGLAIVREVAALHGGRATVRQTPGGGATFGLELPEATNIDRTPQRRQTGAM